MEQKEKKKNKSSAAKGRRISEEQEAAVTEREDSNMAWFTFQMFLASLKQNILYKHITSGCATPSMLPLRFFNYLFDFVLVSIFA